MTSAIGRQRRVPALGTYPVNQGYPTAFTRGNQPSIDKIVSLCAADAVCLAEYGNRHGASGDRHVAPMLPSGSIPSPGHHDLSHYALGRSRFFKVRRYRSLTDDFANGIRRGFFF